MKYGHLERLEVTLRALSPIFIGSGESYNKKEYIFDPQTAQIHFPEFSLLVIFLKDHDLLPRYEEFLLQPRQNDFRAFLKENNITEQEYSYFIQYSIDAGEAAQASNFREVLTFIKDAHGYPYVPGSSLKGAIRTAIAAQLIREGDFNRERQNINRADTNVPPRKYLSRESSNLEKKLFQRLEYRDPKNNELILNPVNDFMQGIRISDSTPLDFEALTLVGKYERKPDGAINLLPIFRECLKPGSETKIRITLDVPILTQAGLTMDSIENALHGFADAHYESIEQHFPELTEDASIAAVHGVDIILGGGTGYASKTVTYNLFTPHELALRKVSEILNKQFPRHGHNKDVTMHQVSPHILKTTIYKGQYYQMGRCELIVE
jgi:CRISPR-associated protein Csm5